MIILLEKRLYFYFFYELTSKITITTVEILKRKKFINATKSLNSGGLIK